MLSIASTLHFTGDVEGGKYRKVYFLYKSQKSVRCSMLLKPCSLDEPPTCIIYSLALGLPLSLDFKQSCNEEFQLEVYLSTK